MESPLLRTLLPLLALPLILHAQVLPARTAVVELRIDGTEADLTRIDALAVSPQGRIAFTQRKDRVVKVFRDGEGLATVGRDGGGPGEFRFPRTLGWLGDSLWIYDSQLKRVTWYGPDLTLLRDDPRPTPEELSRPAERQVAGSVLRVFDGGEFLMMVGISSFLPRPPWLPAEAPGDQAVVRYSAATGRISLPILYPTSRTIDCFTEVKLDNGRLVLIAPFCSFGRWDASPDGRLLATATPERTDGDGIRMQLELTDIDGRTRYSRGFAPKLTAVPRAVADSVLGEPLASPRLSPVVRRAYESLRPARYYPPFDGVRVSDDGWVWVGRANRDESHTWTAHDPSGEPRYTVELPVGARLVVVGRDRLWGIETDDDGVQSVVRWRVG
jgi:hypothetical protein